MSSRLKVKYIHTLECSTSSKLCDLTLNRDQLSQCVRFKNLLIASMWINLSLEVEYLIKKHWFGQFIPALKDRVFLPIDDKIWYYCDKKYYIKKCSACKGTGDHYDMSPLNTFKTICRICNGNGVILKAKGEKNGL